MKFEDVEKDSLVMYKCEGCGNYNFSERTKRLKIGNKKIQICIDCIKRLALMCLNELDVKIRVVEVAMEG